MRLNRSTNDLPNKFFKINWKITLNTHLICPSFVPFVLFVVKRLVP